MNDINLELEKLIYVEKCKAMYDKWVVKEELPGSLREELVMDLAYMFGLGSDMSYSIYQVINNASKEEE